MNTLFAFGTALSALLCCPALGQEVGKTAPPESVYHFRVTQSDVFPGTVHDVTVVVPPEYDGGKPACVYVKTDGYNPGEKDLLDGMISAREIPPMISVWVSPGQVPAPMPETGGRRNRSFEYDGMGDNNVRFLNDELLPLVAKQYKLNLSTDGNDRCIAGGSSGGIAAFTAAWERPDAFSRVYAASGSFVAFRGGNAYPTMVRKFEAKPIRAFLTTATHDMENAAGDWFLLDQEMDKALKFSGYDYQFRIVEGKHVAGYRENFHDALSFLWHGWPERVKAGPSGPRAQDILLPDEAWKELPSAGGGVAAAANAKGEVFIVDPAANQIRRLNGDGSTTVFVADAGHANGIAISAGGKPVTVSEQTGVVTTYDDNGKGSQLAEGLKGRSILALPNGDFYVTANEKDGGAVWFLKDGRKTKVGSGPKLATGLAYRPDQWLLAVADGASKWAYSYQFGEDGSLSNKERFFCLHVADGDDDAGANEVCYAQEGQIFIATRTGLQICADDGALQVILPLPDRSAVSGVCLGGAGLDTLYALCANKMWTRHVKVHGIGAFSPWFKVGGTKL